MRELHLFAGLGGGILAGALLGHRCVAAVEVDSFCREVLHARQADGSLPSFPVFQSVCAGDREQRELFADPGRFVATEWRGRADVVAGGFPCQDISDAGKRVGLEGARSGLWWEMHRIIREVEPRFVFVENVAALLGRGFDRVLGSLAELGFDAEWCVLSAADCGAPHLRKRLWLLAGHPDRQHDEAEQAVRAGEPSDSSGVRADTDADRRRCEEQRLAKPARVEGARRSFADGFRAARRQRRTCVRYEVGARLEVGQGECQDDGAQLAAAVGAGSVDDAVRGRHRAPDESLRTGWLGAELPSWWATEPDVGRVAHGVPNRVGRLRGLGNAQVPVVAARAFRLLMERLVGGTA